MGRTRRAGLLGAALAFTRSEQGKRVIAQARARLDTPENRRKVQDTVRDLRAGRGRRAP